MTLDDFQTLAYRTAKTLGHYDALVHAALLATSEAGELATTIKAHVVYNKPLDKANVIEELGDLLWTVAYCSRLVGVKLDDVGEKCLDKLRKRYPDKYSDELAIARLDKV